MIELKLIKTEIMKNYHLTHKDEKWHLKMENSSKAIKSFETKDQALDYSQDYMKKNEGSLKIHNQDGTI